MITLALSALDSFSLILHKPSSDYELALMHEAYKYREPYVQTMLAYILRNVHGALDYKKVALETVQRVRKHVEASRRAVARYADHQLPKGTVLVGKHELVEAAIAEAKPYLVWTTEEHGIHRFVSYSDVYGLMSTIKAVLLGCYGITPKNQGICAKGDGVLATVANGFGVPVYVLALSEMLCDATDGDIIEKKFVTKYVTEMGVVEPKLISSWCSSSKFL
ncbi:hypothetical protein H6504_02860 [Candidatus Woesearchaeota archaeon]|nr:hypothetical protein [Candidatus Woesearchaeota archaeon]